MNAKTNTTSVETLKSLEVAIRQSAEDLTAQVHLEYTRYLEKRDLVRLEMRKLNGRLRRSTAHSQLAS